MDNVEDRTEVKQNVIIRTSIRWLKEFGVSIASERQLRRQANLSLTRIPFSVKRLLPSLSAINQVARRSALLLLTTSRT